MKLKVGMVLAAFGMATVLSACGGNAQAAETYCVDQNGMVLDDDYCDEDSGFYSPTYMYWHSYDDDHHYKKGKKIPSADFRKGKTEAPKTAAKSSTSAPKSSAGKSSSAPKTQTKTSAPKATQKAPAPKAQSAPKAKTGK